VFGWHGISLVVLCIVHREIFVFVEFITIIMLLYGHTQSGVIQGRRNDPQRLEKRESRWSDRGNE
jgi:hypothetical protein